MSESARPALLAEWPLLPIVATTALFLLFGKGWLADLGNPVWLGLMFGWLFAIILWSAIRVVHHAECLAQKLGEPYGTLILTLSVITIEVMMIATLMLHGSNNPGLARDTMFAVVMIVLNGLVGLSLLLGALRYREQQYNLQGANAYLSVILPLAVLALILPDFTVSTEEPSLSGFQALFLVVMTLALYGTFLAIQTVRHTGYFTVLGDCRNETYCMAPDSRSPSRSANSRIVVLCRCWRDKEGGREDKPGGMFHDRNRLSRSIAARFRGCTVHRKLPVQLPGDGCRLGDGGHPGGRTRPPGRSGLGRIRGAGGRARIHGGGIPAARAGHRARVPRGLPIADGAGGLPDRGGYPGGTRAGRRLPRFPVPVVLLGRLAVQLRCFSSSSASCSASSMTGW
jgi:hypothetical protein